MKRALLIAVVMGLGVTVDANAQQRPAPINPSGTATTGTSYAPPRYPMTAARYEVYAQILFSTLRRAVGHHSITQGDVNKAILALKDCTSKIEADGIVTRSESDYCKLVLRQKVHEIATPYLIQYAAEH